MKEDFGYLDKIPHKITETEIRLKKDTLQASIEAKERQKEKSNEAARRAIETQIKKLKDELEVLEKEDGIGHA